MTDTSVVSLRGVSKRYTESILSVDNIDLDIASGEFISLLGPSGCGKTTTLRLIAGFEGPTSGQIFIDGRDLTVAPPYGRPVNTVFQDYALFPHLNVSDNVGFGLSLAGVGANEARTRIREMLDLVGLADKAKARVQDLSGGQQQRMAIARALAMSPDYMLFDEATSALDPQLVGEVLDTMRMLAEDGMTMILVTHEIRFARDVSDRVAFFRNGLVHEIGTPDQVIGNPQRPETADFLRSIN